MNRSNQSNCKKPNFAGLGDQDLLLQTRLVVQRERQVLTLVLHHLLEVERRRLFSDLGFQSLFEYCVKELKYSEGQAGRRVQAMRLIKEIPQVEAKIRSGVLSLTNVSQAQSFFRESKREQPRRPIGAAEKLAVLTQLENKSAREGLKVLVAMGPARALPKESERVLSATHFEMKFVMTDDLRERLEKVRSLLGPKGAHLNFAQLVWEMTELSVGMLEAKKFGKKRVLALSTPAPELNCSSLGTKKALPLKASKKQTRPKMKILGRYLPAAVRHHVWVRDKGQCTKCRGRRNLHIDHIQPVALGGESCVENLRLLCFQCNQRQGIKTFGVGWMRSFGSNTSGRDGEITCL